jgi:hypothetical protein
VTEEEQFTIKEDNEGRLFLEIDGQKSILQDNIAKAIRANPDKIPSKYKLELRHDGKLSEMKEQLKLNADELRQQINKTLESKEPLVKERVDALVDQAAHAEQIKMRLEDIEKASRTVSKRNVEQSFAEKLKADAEKLDRFIKGEIREAPLIDSELLGIWVKLRTGKDLTDAQRKYLLNAERQYQRTRRSVYSRG